MQTKTKVILTIVGFTLFGFMLGPQAPLGSMLWPPADLSAHYGTPTGGEVALLMTYGLLSSIAFGIGFAFLLFGGPLVRRLPIAPTLARLAHFAVFWLLATWVPHDSLHQHITSITALVALEYGFHLTLILGGVVLASTFVSAARASGASAGSVVGASATAITAKR